MGSDAFSRCHPLVNFIFFLGAIGFGVVIQHPVYIGIGLVCAAVYCLVLDPRKAVRSLAGLIPMIALISLVNPLFNTQGTHILFTLFGRPYTLEALCYGLAVGGIFAVMMLWFVCYSQVMTSDKFLALFGSRIPSLSLLLTMVLRMIPNLMRKAGQLLLSRRSIGKGAAESASLREKLGDGMTLISALTDWALEGSIVTADSMRSRGYGCTRRTSFRIYRFTLRDGALTALMLILSVLTLVSGGTQAGYTPEFFMDPPGWGLVFYLAFLLIPIAVSLKEAIVWHISISGI